MDKNNLPQQFTNLTINNELEEAEWMSLSWMNKVIKLLS
jgi:hypothetical protein